MANSENKAVDNLSIEVMIKYIVSYGNTVVARDKQKAHNILDIVFYEEKECISSSGKDDEECVLINLDKIQNKDKIKQIYNIIHKIVESLKTKS